MATKAWCSICNGWILVTAEGACPNGHPRSHLRGLCEVESAADGAVQTNAPAQPASRAVLPRVDEPAAAGFEQVLSIFASTALFAFVGPFISAIIALAFSLFVMNTTEPLSGAPIHWVVVGGVFVFVFFAWGTFSVGWLPAALTGLVMSLVWSLGPSWMSTRTVARALATGAVGFLVTWPFVHLHNGDAMSLFRSESGNLDATFVLRVTAIGAAGLAITGVIGPRLLNRRESSRY